MFDNQRCVNDCFTKGGKCNYNEDLSVECDCSNSKLAFGRNCNYSNYNFYLLGPAYIFDDLEKHSQSGEISIQKNEIVYLKYKTGKNSRIELNIRNVNKPIENATNFITINLSYELDKNKQPKSQFSKERPDFTYKITNSTAIKIDQTETENIFLAIHSEYEVNLFIIFEKIFIDPNSYTQNPEKREELGKIITITFLSFMAFMVVCVGLCVFIFKRAKRKSVNTITPSNSDLNSVQESRNNDDDFDLTLQQMIEESIIRDVDLTPRPPPRPQTPNFPSLNMKMFEENFPIITGKDLSKKQWENLDKCAICYNILFLKNGEKLPEGEEIKPVRIIEECNHMFHEHCLIKWFLEEENVHVVEDI